jgi:hypothetical protein
VGNVHVADRDLHSADHFADSLPKLRYVVNVLLAMFLYIAVYAIFNEGFGPAGARGLGCLYIRAIRGGLAFLDTKLGLDKWMNGPYRFDS